MTVNVPMEFDIASAFKVLCDVAKVEINLDQRIKLLGGSNNDSSNK